MAQDLGQFTDMWMNDPYMFDPSQKLNKFSNYNNARLPYPPTYNGTPVSAATGKPIQSYLDWQQANPGGMTLNSTPAQPAPQSPSSGAQFPPGSPLARAQQMGATPAQMQGMFAQMSPSYPGGQTNPNYAQSLMAMMGTGGMGAGAAPGQAAATGGASQAGPPPNNWQAALNALANPGNPVTPGATVPLQTGSQPAGGVNQAFLQNAGAGQGMNPNFLSALRAIQNR